MEEAKENEEFRFFEIQDGAIWCYQNDGTLEEDEWAPLATDPYVALGYLQTERHIVSEAIRQLLECIARMETGSSSGELKLIAPSVGE